MYRPVLDVTVGTRTLTGGPWRLDVVQSESAFDAAILTIPRGQASPIIFARNTPIHIAWGRTPALVNVFPGYIDHVETRRSQREAEARIICLGAGSRPLRDAASRQWPVGSAADIAVQQIADKVHLSSLTESSDTEAPGGPVNESWWAYIRRAAKASGFTCYVTGTDVRFHSRRINAGGTGVPFFIGSVDVRVRIGNVLFEYDLTDADDDSYSVHRRRRVYGMTDEGLVVQYTDTGDLESVGGLSQDLPTLTRNEGFVVNSMGDAASRLKARQEQNRFTKRSNFLVSGNETVRQSSTVIIRGMTAELDGYWYVMKAIHRVTPSSYTMALTAGRDGVGDSSPPDLHAVPPIIGLGVGEPVKAPAPVLRAPVTGSPDLVFPTKGAAWTASSLLHRKHAPGRAAVRG